MVLLQMPLTDFISSQEEQKLGEGEGAISSNPLPFALPNDIPRGGGNMTSCFLNAGVKQPPSLSESFTAALLFAFTAANGSDSERWLKNLILCLPL